MAADSFNLPQSLISAGVGTPDWIWRNGELIPWHEATIHVNSVGHASVAAVFEGIKAYLARDEERLLVFRLDDHLRRLGESARICRLSLPYGVSELSDAVSRLLVANGRRQDTYIRPWAFPSGLIREQLVPAGIECEIVIDSWQFTEDPEGRKGCRAAVSSWRRVSDAVMPPRAKAFSNYHNGRLAAMEARQNGHDWPILLNDQHKVCEGAGACIGLVRNGAVITPALTSGVLDSITRDSALTLLRGMGVPVEVRDVDRSELYLAEEIFFMGTALEILPTVAIDGLTVGDGEPGPVTTRLSHAYQAVVRGLDGRYAEWLTEVKL